MDKEKLAQQYIEQKNRTPLDEFDGFSPEAMYKIVYFPFSEECPIQLNSALDNRILTQIPIFRIVLDLLNIIEKENGLKLTPKRNLATKIVKNIYSKKYLVDHLIENGITKLQREENWIVLHTIKIVLNLSGITRKYKGKLLLTKQTKNNLENDKVIEIFLKFLTGYITQFNWAYNDRYGNEEIGQIGFLYLLYLIKKYGDTYRDLTFYVDRYYKAFPVLKVTGKKIYGIDLNESKRIVELRFFERFAAWFGFVEIQYQDKKNYFSGIDVIKKTEILNKLLTTIKQTT